MLSEKKYSDVYVSKIVNSLDNISLQSWPRSVLYIVATPIGNLGDITLRALFCLNIMDLIAVEDTRVSNILFNFYGIKKTLISAHKYSEKEVAVKICKELSSGNRVALVSDAGSPVISDPGSTVIEFVRNQGYKVVPIPGASAVTTALMGAGITNYENPGYFFAGFIPTKRIQRLSFFKKNKNLNIPLVMFDSPHRIVSSLNDLLDIFGPLRLVTIARELTKKFEEISTFQLQHYLEKFATKYDNKGEFVVIIHSSQDHNNNDELIGSFDDDILSLISDGLSLSDIIKVIAKTTGVSKSKLYEHSIKLVSKNV
ncbi:16S rRNA (cytidine(1402)-2'-O)-methyltransferase [Candidatus Kinetoplastidibacterium crithidiae]|uniref:Ribosomal RNA small subunit methyltransferase I n=1 Tax=Candidatus Kinetoplastidibacterium crithidiae TCC036E TaxID=1208918 RepID=M1M771_9PROT|nr:16S rRNA (cytidine(1402)-2'-O)-methyltransferase [Candidatus Kinetoplastibacterium crithidii]AFZ82935.1 16S rRNA (cytidine1402-2'-O)-methyltransferase [Candidatus Kinetoplastibacterium crithidii (ex Angomonas deanei ATCC 30255)]AGF47935.1 S-adenosylmethionine-dependent methyltransferase [Candidatus Kinetoplastibacterium crithidii TCC036E]